MVLAYLMRFKQICNHPSQWLGEQAYEAAASGKFQRLRDICDEIASRQEKALIPTPAEISLKCSCPDWATMCKHVAAVLYGVGARLDQAPELLFRLRDVDHRELIAVPEVADLATAGAAKEKIIAEEELAGIFGIELDSGMAPAGKEAAGKPKQGRPAAKPKPAVSTAEPPPVKPPPGRKKLFPNSE